MTFKERLLRDFYMRPGETVEQCLWRACIGYNPDDPELAKRLMEYVQKDWFMFSSPVLSNAPTPGEDIKRKLPISCFLTYVPDSVQGLIEHEAEVRYLSVSGGGVGAHWSDVRAIGQSTSGGGSTPGIIPFMHCTDSAMLAYHQGSTRRGSCAVYLDISHPEIQSFIEMRIPEGDVNRQNLNLHHAVNITDKFTGAVLAGDSFPLVDPNSGDVVSTVDARALWTKILETRYRTGEPYLNFIDRAREAMHPALKKYSYHGSNLCNEIHLPTDENRTAVCCLSSVNVEYFDDWRNHPNFIGDCIRFLDNVLTHFVNHAATVPGLARAVNSARSERSIGLGAMGWHYLLQRKGIPWESALAVSLNKRVFSLIQEKAKSETFRLAIERGEPDDLKGWRARNAHLLAIAPNSNSALILGTSPSIEPLKANAYEQSTRAGVSMFKNKYLEQELEKLGMNTKDVWLSIMANEGSVQHLELPESVKEVFKTANEINQHWVVQHASDRQEFICQGQSVNLFFPRNADRNYVNSVHLLAARSNLKGLYYLRTDGKPVENLTVPVVREALTDSCLACEG